MVVKVHIDINTGVGVYRKLDAAKFRSDAADQCEQVLLSSGDGRRHHGVEQFVEPCISTLCRVTRHQCTAARCVSQLL